MSLRIVLVLSLAAAPCLGSYEVAGPYYCDNWQTLGSGNLAEATVEEGLAACQASCTAEDQCHGIYYGSHGSGSDQHCGLCAEGYNLFVPTGQGDDYTFYVRKFPVLLGTGLNCYPENGADRACTTGDLPDGECSEPAHWADGINGASSVSACEAGCAGVATCTHFFYRESDGFCAFRKNVVQEECAVGDLDMYTITPRWTSSYTPRVTA